MLFGRFGARVRGVGIAPWRALLVVLLPLAVRC